MGPRVGAHRAPTTPAPAAGAPPTEPTAPGDPATVAAGAPPTAAQTAAPPPRADGYAGTGRERRADGTSTASQVAGAAREARAAGRAGGDPAMAASVMESRTRAAVSSTAGHQGTTHATAASTAPRSASTASTAGPPAAMVSSTPLARAATPADIPGNMMALRGSVGPGATNREEDVRLLQERLTQLGLYHGPVDSTFNPELGHALADFQRTHAADIRRVVADGRDRTFADTALANRAQQNSVRGRVEPGDATAQALAQAWPHLVGGRQMFEPEAYRYFADQVRARGLPLDESVTNVVGLRGYQAGMAHGNARAGTYQATFDDQLVVLGHHPDGSPLVREFSATTDPGAHRSAEGVDRATFAVLPDQQMTYALEPRGRESYGHADRPGLHWQQRDGVDTPEGHRAELMARHSGDAETFEAGGRAMIHSGAPGPQVQGSSYGCQVPDGNWYPSFYNELERGAGPGGRIRYTILDGSTLTAPP